MSSINIKHISEVISRSLQVDSRIPLSNQQEFCLLIVRGITNSTENRLLDTSFFKVSDAFVQYLKELV